MNFHEGTPRGIWLPDPRGALFCALILSIVLACLQNLGACIAGLGVALVLIILSRQPLAMCLRRLAAVNIFILFIWLIVPWTTPGNTAWQWGILRITYQGIHLSLLGSIKANAILCVFFALGGSLTLSQWGGALRSFHIPHKLVWIFLLAGRNVFFLGEELQKLLDAAKLRAFEVRANLHSWRFLATMLGLLLVRAHARAERQHEAMLLRGFSGKIPFTLQSRFGIADTVFCGAIGCCVTLLCLIEFGVISF